MSRRTSSFARALKDAEKRLEKALAEREECLERVSALTIEIPRLEQIIASLSGKAVPNAGNLSRSELVPTGEHRAVTSADIPSDLLKLAGPQDMTGFGSKYLTEEELLPEPEGTPLTEEE